jgi:hypothetical protein
MHSFYLQRSTVYFKQIIKNELEKQLNIPRESSMFSQLTFKAYIKSMGSVIPEKKELISGS